MSLLEQKNNKMIKNKKGMESEALIKILIVIVLFALISAGIIFLLKRYGVL